MKKKEIVYSYIKKMANHSNDKTLDFTTQELAIALHMQRTNISAILNQLVLEDKLVKIEGRPVIFRMKSFSLDETEFSCFKKMIGYDGSLKNVIQLAKAAIIYPQKPLNMVIIGQKGVGKSLFAQMIYQFAVNQNIIQKDAPFIKLSCTYFVNMEKELLELFNKNSSENIVKKAEGGILFFDHVHLLSPHLRFIIHDLLTISSEKNIIIIFSCSNDIEKGFKEQYIEKIPIKLELPPLQHRSKKECFDFIKLLFQNEAIHMKRYIITEAEILKSLLLYPCEGNLKQLENDIKAGCARAFVREVNNSTGYMKLHLEDFPSCVQKGLIFYKEYIDELDKIILNDYIYTFTYKSMEKIKNNTLHDIKKTLYEVVEDKTIKLKQKGISQQISNLIIRSDFSSDLEKYTENLGNKILDKNSLSKIVDPRIISLTESFLEESSLKLNRIFSLSTFYGICLHISAAIEKPNLRTFVNKQLEEEAKKHQQEYILSIHFIDKIQNEMKIQLLVDEANFITMFISEKEVTKHPVFLIIMHGETTASSVAEVVRTLTKTDHTYAYDLSLKKEISMVYQELKTLIKQIDKGQGILVMYDMGSIRTIGENIAKDTKINISFIEMPITLIALDCARKVSTMSSLQEVYQSVSNSYERYFPYIVETYKRISKDNVIITLCMSGVGGALQIKKYLEKNLIFENLEIIALSMANRNELLYHINHIKKEHNILYTIGTDDPKLYGIPFISVSEIFSIPSEKLQMYFSINGIKVIPKAEMNYQLLFQNISEDLPHISIAGLSETFPQFIEKIDSKYHLNKNQKIGIIMHLSASIERLIVHEKIDSIKDFQKIIIKNKKLYNDVSNGIIPIENYFQIKYPDTEIACLIKIIKKI